MKQINQLADLETFLTCCVVSCKNNDSTDGCILMDASREIDNFELLFGKEVAELLYHHYLRHNKK